MVTILHRYDYLTKHICTKVKKTTSYVFLYRDVFSMAYTYDLMRQWLQERGYGHQHPFEVQNKVDQQEADTRVGMDTDFPEAIYLHKEHPGWGTEIWLRWRCQKVMPEYPLWGLTLDMDMHMLGLNPTEVVIGGKKIKADKGEIEITVVANLLIDMKQQVKNHKILTHFQKFIFDVLYREKQKEAEEILFQDAQDFRAALKEYFKLPTYQEVRELSKTWLKRDQN